MSRQSFHPAALLAAALLVAPVLAQPLPPGPPEPPAVKRGDTVDLSFQRGGVLLVTQGRALATAGVGDSVLVMRDGGLKAVRGTVRGPGLVELGASR